MQIFIKFIGVGGVATAFQYLVLLIGVEWLAMSAVFASSLGFALSSILNYALNYWFTFKADVAHKTAVIRFALVALLGLSLNAVIMFLSTAHVAYLIAQVIATLVVTGVNFILHKFWTYKK